MDQVTNYINEIENTEHRNKFFEVIQWITDHYPSLQLMIKYGQPTFILGKTFILAMSYAKAHLSISPELYTIQYFEDSIKEDGYVAKRMTFAIPWTMDVKYSLLKDMIDLNIQDKQNLKSFWRKPEAHD